MDGRTRRRLETRGQLVAAGVELLRRGDEVTIAAVLDEAQVAHGTFYNHFSSLAEYVDQLVHVTSQDLTERVLAEIPDEHRLDVRFALGYVMYRLIESVRLDPRIGELATMSPPESGQRDADGVEQRVAILQMAIDGGQLPEQDARLLEIASRRVLNAAVNRYVDGGFTDTAERDTAVLQMRLAGIPEPDIAVLIERVEKAVADL